MIVYSVHYKHQNGQSFDSFGGSVIARAAVMQAVKRGEKAEVQPYDVPSTREGVLNALQQFGSHPGQAVVKVRGKKASATGRQPRRDHIRRGRL